MVCVRCRDFPLPINRLPSVVREGASELSIDMLYNPSRYTPVDVALTRRPTSIAALPPSVGSHGFAAPATWFLAYYVEHAQAGAKISQLK